MYYLTFAKIFILDPMIVFAKAMYIYTTYMAYIQGSKKKCCFFFFFLNKNFMLFIVIKPNSAVLCNEFRIMKCLEFIFSFSFHSINFSLKLDTNVRLSHLLLFLHYFQFVLYQPALPFLFNQRLLQS